MLFPRLRLAALFASLLLLVSLATSRAYAGDPAPTDPTAAAMLDGGATVDAATVAPIDAGESAPFDAGATPAPPPAQTRDVGARPVLAPDQPPPPPPRASEEAATRLPVSYIDRPLTLPRFVFNPLGEFDVDIEDVTFVNLTLAGAFGVTDDFQVEAIVAPLKLSPVFNYGQSEQLGPSVGGTYRLTHGAAQLGFEVDTTIISLPGLSGAVVRPGFPTRIHGGRVRFDFGVFLPITASHTTSVGLDLPFALAFDLAEPLHLAFASGLTFAPADNPFQANVPFLVSAGYAIKGKDGPILDIDPFFRLPSVAEGDHYQVGIEVGGFFYL